MIKIIVKNLEGEIKFAPEYETMELALSEKARHITEKNWGEEGTFEVEGPIDISVQIEQEQVNEQSLAYLASTDWLIIREMDEGTPCPAEIKTERAAARARIVR